MRHETGLRHRAFDGIHQQQHRIHHRQNALDFATEIGVSRGIDDVDVIVAPVECSVLGQNRDPALALEIVAVHHALASVLARIERAGLAEQLVDKGRFAMINVRDDGDITEILNHGVGPVGRKGRHYTHALM